MIFTTETQDGMTEVTVIPDIGQIERKTYPADSKELSECIQILKSKGKHVLTDAQKEQAIADWNNADQQQRFWKDKENQLRSLLVEQFYTKETGTQTISLRGDWVLKIERGEDYKLENTNGETEDVLENFSDTEAKLLVRWKAEVVKKNFDALEKEKKDLFAAVLTIKPSSPQVKLIPPKVPVS